VEATQRDADETSWADTMNDRDRFDEVLGFVEARNGVTFNDIEKQHPWMFDSTSDIGLRATGVPHLWMWVGLTEEGLAFFEDDETRKRIRPGAATILHYAHDGKAPALPVAGDWNLTPQGFTEPHWIPTQWFKKDDDG